MGFSPCGKTAKGVSSGAKAHLEHVLYVGAKAPTPVCRAPSIVLRTELRASRTATGTKPASPRAGAQVYTFRKTLQTLPNTAYGLVTWFLQSEKSGERFRSRSFAAGRWVAD